MGAEPTADPILSAGADTLLDPQMRAFLQRVAASGSALSDPFGCRIDIARETIEAILRPLATGGPNVASTVEHELVLAGREIRLRHHRPEHAAGPLIVYIHGGGWTWESVETHDRMAREYATRTGFSVLMPDYALAPENPFPAALNECVALLTEIHRNAAEWGAKAGILVIGDSAGANLALSAAMILRDHPARPDALLLNYGAYSRDFDRPSYRWIEESALAPRTAHMRWFWENYRGSASNADWRIEPLLGPFAGLPPMRLQVAELDVLRDENLELARAARAAGIDVEYGVYAGVTHGFLRAVGIVDKADEAFRDAAAWLGSVGRKQHRQPPDIEPLANAHRSS